MLNKFKISSKSPLISFKLKISKFVLIMIFVGSKLWQSPFAAAQSPPNPATLHDVSIYTNVSNWKNNGWTGEDINIGILDRGFAGLTEFQASTDADVSVVDGTDEANLYPPGVTNQGTNVLEVIHFIAPDATLYPFRYDTLSEFTAGVNAFILAGDIDIVVSVSGVPTPALSDTRAWTDALKRATDRGILWINAAGNFNTGYMEEVFVDTDGDHLHEFTTDRDDKNSLYVDPLNTMQYGSIALSWDDLDAPRTNLDLYIIDQMGETLYSSTKPQNAQLGQRPEEYVSFMMDRPFNIQIWDVNLNAGLVPFSLFVEFANLPNSSQLGGVIAPGNSPDAMTVGALKGAGYEVQTTSSRGLPDASVIKPDIVTVGNIRLSSGEIFSGTAAAASVAAGAAALIWEAHPDMDRVAILDYMRRNSVKDDQRHPGPDNEFGYGLLYMSSVHPKPQPIEIKTTIFRTRNSVTIYIPGDDAPVFLKDFTFAVGPPEKRSYHRLCEYADFDGLNFENIPTPICFRLEIENNEEHPLECQNLSNERRFTQSLPPGNAFWLDPFDRSERLILIARGNTILEDQWCQAGAFRCVISYVLPTPTTPTPTLTPTPTGSPTSTSTQTPTTEVVTQTFTIELTTPAKASTSIPTETPSNQSPWDLTPTPVVQLHTEPRSPIKIKPGDCVIFSWTTERIEQVYMNDVLQTGTSITVCPSDTKEYTFRFVGHGGNWWSTLFEIVTVSQY